MILPLVTRDNNESNDMTKTIFALASAAGKSGVGVFRISGTNAGAALIALGFTKRPEPRRAILKKIRKGAKGDVIDEALVLWFPAPASYTGEDVAELHIHGSTAVISDLTQFLNTLPDTRLAEPGEFSRRAFENDKMDLTILEGISDLIDAETAIQQKQALRQMDGELERLYEKWRTEIIHILARVEAYIDFPDEDIPEDIERSIRANAQKLQTQLQAHASDDRGERLRNGLYAAIVGAPNVGKSSLMNLLTKRDVAIVSDIKGTTRDIIEAHLDIGGYPLTIADTAGLRESTDEIESKGIALAKKRAKHADFTLCMFDSNEEPDDETLTVLDEASIIIVNKCDMGKSINHNFGERLVFPISVQTGEGIDSLLAFIKEQLDEKVLPSSNPVFTRERHRKALIESADHLSRFLKARENSLDVELAAEDLRIAAVELGSITGRIDVEDLLDEIFSSFCIGK
jgi:tRNA modification GTPase